MASLRHADAAAGGGEGGVEAQSDDQIEEGPKAHELTIAAQGVVIDSIALPVTRDLVETGCESFIRAASSWLKELRIERAASNLQPRPR